MGNRKTIVAIVVLVAGALGGYFLAVKGVNMGSGQTNTEELAVKETIDFVSYFDRIHPDKIKLVSAEKTEWSDGCLEVAQDGELCIKMLVPGYKIVLDADGTIMVFHTDKTGSSIRRNLKAEEVN